MDIQKAKETFASYVKPYQANDGRVQLKIIHSMKVAQIAKEIAIHLGLCEEDIQLAEIIGLFHDIGRFEQLKRYDTFLDSKSVDHAELGVKILKETKMLSSFVEEEYIPLILDSIQYHNKYQVPKDISEKTKLHASIIRDADKTDIFRVNLMEKEEHVYLCTKEELLEETITKEVFDDFMQGNLILSSKRKTHVDILLSHIAFIFDFVYDYGLMVIQKESYIEDMIDRYQFKDVNVQKQMQEAKAFALQYLANRVNKL